MMDRVKIQRFKWCAPLLLVVLTAGATTNDGLEAEIEALWAARLFGPAYEQLAGVLAARPDDPVANRLVAHAYQEGLGVGADQTKAIMHLQRAASAADSNAMYVLGESYASGQGVAKSPEAALTWFERAAGAHPKAAYRYAEIILANQERGGIEAKYDPVERLRFASSGGVPQAQYLLAGLLLQGVVKGIEGENAEKLLGIAAETLPEAQTALGVLYHQRRDFSAARPLFEAAYASGEASAAAYLGHYAEAGIGQDIDRRLALARYEAASDVPWAREGAARIRAHLSSIEVMGLRIYASTRGEITRQMQAQGLLRIDGAAHWDAYDVSDLVVAGPAVLTIGYAPGPSAFVAELNYQFGAETNRRARELQQELYTLLNAKYGQESSSERKSDAQIRMWVIDATEIQLRFVARKHRVNVTYQMHPFVAQLRAYVEKQGEQQDGRIRNAL